MANKRQKASDEMLKEAIENVMKKWHPRDELAPHKERWYVWSVQNEIHRHDICDYGDFVSGFTATGKRILAASRPISEEWFPSTEIRNHLLERFKELKEWITRPLEGNDKWLRKSDLKRRKDLIKELSRLETIWEQRKFKF